MLSSTSITQVTEVETRMCDASLAGVAEGRPSIGPWCALHLVLTLNQ